MILAPTVRYSLLSLLAVCTALAFYICNNLDILVQTAISRSLQKYGVTHTRAVNVYWQHNQLMLDSLWLQGQDEHIRYTLSFSGIHVTYHWREILKQRLNSVRIESVDIDIEDRRVRSPSSFNKTINFSAFNPSAILSGLPLIQLNIETWRLRYQKNRYPALSVTGDLHLDKRLSLGLKAAVSGANVTGLITTNAEKHTLFDLAITGDNGKVASLYAELDSETATWHWKTQGHWQQDAFLEWLRHLHLDFAVPILPIANINSGEGNGHFFGHIEHPDTIELSTNDSNSPAPNINASLTLKANIASITYPGIADDISSDMTAALSLQQGKLNLDFTLSDTTITPTTSNYTLLLKSFHMKSDTAVFPSFTADSRAEGKLEILHRDHVSPAVSFSLEQSGSLRDSAYALNAALPGDSLKLTMGGNIEPETGRGEHRIEINSDNLSKLNVQLLPAIKTALTLPTLPDITSGKLQLSTKMQSTTYDPSHWSQTSHLDIEGFSATYDGYAVEQASLTARSIGFGESLSLQPINVTIESLNAGFPVTGVTMNAALGKATPTAAPVFDITDFSARVFNGTVALESPTRWRFSAATNEFTLRVEDWDLAQLVALQQNRDISAVGTLQGILPIAVVDDRLVISEGHLDALPPGGIIRYDNSDMARDIGNDSGLELALALLTDFHYEILATSVHLDTLGNLVLALSLGGRNPEYYEGQDVQFNIRVEQNLDPLLQSLRLSDTLTRNIEQRLH